MAQEKAKLDWEPWLALEPVLKVVLGKHCPDANVVEDITQETFLRAALYGRLAPKGRALRSWLIRIGMNALADHKNRNARYDDTLPTSRLVEEVPSEEELLDGEVDLAIGRYVMGQSPATGLMQRSLGAVAAEDRQILRSVYFEGQSTRHTAQRCSIPQHLVKGRAYRARQRLGRAMRHRAALEHGQCGV